MLLKKKTSRIVISGETAKRAMMMKIVNQP
jgi:hypothetical protein